MKAEPPAIASPGRYRGEGAGAACGGGGKGTVARRRWLLVRRRWRRVRRPLPRRRRRHRTGSRRCCPQSSGGRTSPCANKRMVSDGWGGCVVNHLFCGVFEMYQQQYHHSQATSTPLGTLLQKRTRV